MSGPACSSKTFFTNDIVAPLAKSWGPRKEPHVHAHECRGELRPIHLRTWPAASYRLHMMPEQGTRLTYPCPRLQRESYTPENTERLLDEAARFYVNEPRNLRIDAARNRVTL